MAKKKVLWMLAVLVFMIGTVIGFYQPVIRPWHTRWGATDAETRLRLAGDEVIQGEVNQSTRAIDIQAPIGQVWPWLLQLGQGRGGLYSYDFLENLVGCDIHTLDTIDPALQGLQVGDVIRIGKQAGLPSYHVVRLEPEAVLVLRVVDAETGEEGDATWGFYLEEKSSTLTRLLIRHRDQPAQDATTRIVNAVFDPISFVMERRMLYGIRDHAESQRQVGLK